MKKTTSPRERLVATVHELERLVEAKQAAAADLAEAFADAKRVGFDPTTLRVVLKLRKMTPSQRRERRALEAIYMAALGMLEGDALPDLARRRLAGEPDAPPPPKDETTTAAKSDAKGGKTKPPKQPPLVLKTPDEARKDGAADAAAGKRIYDNPFPAGDPCRAAWDEGWCAERKSNGMEPPSAYQRRAEKPADKPEDKPEDKEPKK